MANEIQISLSISCEKNGAKFIRQETFKDDQTGDAWSTGVVDATIAGVQLADLQVGDYGWIFVKNLGTDSSLYVDIQHAQNSVDDGICRLYGGESSLFKHTTQGALWADSSSGTQAVEYAIIEL